MKKALAIILSVMMLMSTLVACGSKTDDSGDANNDAAAGYPTKNVNVIVPFSAGGNTDMSMRALLNVATSLDSKYTFVVDNKTGNAGLIGMEALAEADPDGYTLGTCSVDLITLPLLGLAPAETTRDAFDPICVINGEPAAIIVRADSRWNTIQDFLAEAKEKPDAVQLANSGMGNIWHLAAIGIELETGASFNHVPFDGAASALTAVLGGHVDAVTCSAAEAASNIASGELKVLAVANTERLEAYPDVPTFQEVGVDLTIVALRGLCVNKDPPDNVKKALCDGFEKVINSDACREKIEAANMTYMPLNAQETNDILDSMSGNFEKIINAYLNSAN